MKGSRRTGEGLKPNRPADGRGREASSHHLFQHLLSLPLSVHHLSPLPLALSYDNIGTYLDRTTRCMKSQYTKAFKKHGYNLTPEQWVLLDELNRRGACSQTDLAGGTYKDAPTVSRIVDKLVKKDLAKRDRFPGDRRRYQVVLTERGQAAVRELLPVVLQLREQTWSGLSEEDYGDFRRILDSIRENFGAE